MIKTVEAACIDAQWNKCETLFVDEASTIELCSILPIIGSCKKLRLFGDSNQINFVDMSNTPGIRDTPTLLSLCKNVQKLNHTHRQG